MATEPECRGWRALYAFFATEPPAATGEENGGGPPRPGGALDVVGSCTFPTAGFSAELKLHEPQFAGEHLLLDLVVREPPSSTTAGSTEVTVDYFAEMGLPTTVTVLGYASMKVRTGLGGS